MQIRYHLDEHVPPSIALALRRRGIDVISTVESGLRTASDRQHIDYALKERRVIFTNDDDFLALAASGVPHAGMVFL